jgi:hypothetical protein
MPIMTMLDLAAFGRHDRAAAFAIREIAEPVAREKQLREISSAVRLRTRRCVPVWQKEQVSVQPTWLEMQSVPRPSSGI